MIEVASAVSKSQPISAGAVPGDDGRVVGSVLLLVALVGGL